MRTFISYFLIALLSFGLFMNEAAAKRFGGGRSFGVQRAHSSLYSPNKASYSQAFNQKRPNASKWGGLVSGLLIGGLLTSLFMGHGLTSGILSWLIIGGLIFFAINLFRRKIQPGYQSSQARSPLNPNPLHQFTQAFQSNGAAPQNGNDFPAGFTPDTFLREAKVTFNRLQAAYDQKNLQDINEFTAPEIFAEIKMQLDELGDAPNKTEVIALDAELLDVTKQSNSYIASVRFTGSIKENNEPITQLDEIWHFRQFAGSNQWVVGGIQQDVFQP